MEKINETTVVGVCGGRSEIFPCFLRRVVESEAKKMLQHSAPGIDRFTKLAKGLGVALVLVDDGMQCSGGFLFHSRAIEEGLKVSLFEEIFVSVARDEGLPCNRAISGADADGFDQLCCLSFQSSTEVMKLLDVVNVGVGVD